MIFISWQSSFQTITLSVVRLKYSNQIINSGGSEFFILIVSHNLERVDVTFFAQASLNNIE
jgi:hypothetical protein